MEQRDADAEGRRLLVDYSGTALKDTGQRQGRHAVVYNEKQESELLTLDQETRLMRAMTEIRAYTPKNMTPAQRDAFAVLCEGILRQHGITPETYAQQFGHLGTRDQLHR
jgi:hypothetical protein